MLLPNTTIWHTRVQNIDALLTAVSPSGSEVYRLATVCQVCLEPPMLSISPNREYPICAAIDAVGYFGVNYVADQQAALVKRLYTLPRDCPDKLGALKLRFELTEHGTPLLLDCIESLEIRVEQAWNSGDHGMYIGCIVGRHPGALAGSRPHRFGGATPPVRRFLKRLACQTGVFDLVMALRYRFRPPETIEGGTRRYIPGRSSRVSHPSTGGERHDP